MPVATAFQTIGPFWALIEHPEMADLTRFGADGEVIVLTGRITDRDGAPVTDAAVELWQASPAADERFPGWGRSRTDEQGRFRFTTIRPGSLPPAVGARGNTQQAPHVALNIFARGILTRLVTRAYFAGDPLNEQDAVLGMIDEPRRRATLIAQPAGERTWNLDVRLQGEGETVFMEF
jgi:protocatechuate 3,4-dioxygenase, alpha subunit